jgi:transcriptional regulator with XRE-family HTH domain
MDLRERIRSVIDERDDLTVRNVSLRAGLSDSWLHKLLKGEVRSPTLEAIEKVADVLEVDPRWLAFGEGDPERYTEIGKTIEGLTETQANLAREMLEAIKRMETGT